MNSNYFVVSALILALTVSSGLKAEEEPEARPDTFTDTEANKDMLDPYNLGLLVERGDVKAINNVGLLWAT